MVVEHLHSWPSIWQSTLRGTVLWLLLVQVGTGCGSGSSRPSLEEAELAAIRGCYAREEIREGNMEDLYFAVGVLSDPDESDRSFEEAVEGYLFAECGVEIRRQEDGWLMTVSEFGDDDMTTGAVRALAEAANCSVNYDESDIQEVGDSTIYCVND